MRVIRIIRSATLLLAGLSACTGTAAIGPAVAYMPNRANAKCAIVKVVDGDTVHVQCVGSEKTSARLMGFDTPETYRPRCPAEAQLGAQATRYLEQVLRRAETIQPQTHGTDKYQRLLLELTVDGRPLPDIMVEAGYAYRYDGGKRRNWCDILGA